MTGEVKRRIARLLWRSVINDRPIKTWRSGDRWYGTAGGGPIYLGTGDDGGLPGLVEDLDGLGPGEAREYLRELAGELPADPDRVRVRSPVFAGRVDASDPELLLTLVTGAYSPDWGLAAPLLHGSVTLVGGDHRGLIIQEEGRGWREPVYNRDPRPPTVTRCRDRIIVRGPRGDRLTDRLVELIRECTGETPVVARL